MKRKASLRRNTRETRVEATLDIDGRGRARVDTGVPFLDHMLTSLAVHGAWDLALRARGDLKTGDHHTVEDVAIVLGKALAEAVASGPPVMRFGEAAVPMDESIARVSLDIGGRAHTVFRGEFSEKRIGGLTTRNARHFFETLARSASLTLHVHVEGDDDHHKLEAAFKALGVALRRAIQPDPRRKEAASAKGAERVVRRKR
ncbi:MAG: imidazoleglycerol-phosphate dehydratase HisB [Euryarchaeota archaeon]|nr:imidazoleglycerol-phosphate dehydratase HisB [Euryarchaeota archaeon]